MNSNRVWLSYDLGINGEYEDLYRWLDAHQARECGDSLASFIFEYKKDLFVELTKELKEVVKFRAKDRVYLVYANDQEEIKGRFIIGRRKRAPWEGYAETAVADMVDEG